MVVSVIGPVRRDAWTQPRLMPGRGIGSGRAAQQVNPHRLGELGTAGSEMGLESGTHAGVEFVVEPVLGVGHLEHAPVELGEISELYPALLMAVNACSRTMRSSWNSFMMSL